MQYFILVFAWLVFGVLHSVLAAGVVKRKAMLLMKRSYKYYRLFYSLSAIAILAWVLHLHFSAVDAILWRPPLIEKIVAVIAVTGGLVITLICIKKYFLYLSGIDVFLDQEKAVPVLQRVGLHAYVRHPLYFGTLLFVWGLFIGYPYMNNLVSCLCITLYTVTGVYFEEKKLALEYGEAYSDYQRRVPALFPGLKKRGTI